MTRVKKIRFLECVFLGNWDNIYYCYIKSVGIGIIPLSLLETLRPLRPLRLNHSETTVNDISPRRSNRVF